MSKNRFIQWFVSTWIVQVLMRAISGGWCFIRPWDRRLTVGDSLWYEGSPAATPGKHRPGKWDTFLCFRVTTPCDAIVFDTYTGQRLALFRTFRVGDLIACKVGAEDALIRLGARGGFKNTVRAPEMVGRWTGGPYDFPQYMRGAGITPGTITYI